MSRVRQSSVETDERNKIILKKSVFFFYSYRSIKYITRFIPLLMVCVCRYFSFLNIIREEEKYSNFCWEMKFEMETRQKYKIIIIITNQSINERKKEWDLLLAPVVEKWG